MRLPAIVLAALLVSAACTVPQAGGPAPSGKPAPSSPATPTPSPTPTPARPSHVFVIVIENGSYENVMAQPYLAGLAARYGQASNYHPISSPSLPNYLAMTSGSTWGIRDDAFHQLPATGIGHQLTDAGISWAAYMEGFTGDCFHSPYPYALKHNPFAYYGGQCPSNILPMTQLATDLAGTTPQLSWITPGLCNDGHDCSRRVGDQWLAATVPQITASPAWTDNGVLFIVADESDGTSDRVPFVIVSPRVHALALTAPLDHYALLATLEDYLGVPRLGQAAQANPIVLP